MAVQQLSVIRLEIEDRPGALQEVLAGAAAANTNILHLAAFSAGGGRGQAYLVADNPDAIAEYAESRGLDSAEYAGFLLGGVDSVGVGAEVTKPLSEAGVNIVFSTATVMKGEYDLLIAVEKADADAAAKALGA